MNVLLFLFILTAPVLYEGRYRPLETVPEGESYETLQVENYKELAGTIYIQAEGKALTYPTLGQLKAELVLYTFPFKWIILSTYLLTILFLLIRPKIGWVFLFFGICLHSLALGLRCYVLHRPPVSNMTETLLYVPWIAVCVGMCFYKQKSALIASLISAIFLLFLLPNQISLENVQAVLDSHYWLIVHVLMVVGSYGVFCVAGVCGHIFLLQKHPSALLEKTMIQTLYLGTALLITGTLLGGVWAAESWGRFWDWDPKEAWAFVSSGTYLLGIHAYRFKKISGYGLAIGSIIGLMAITFTWYGVNYILGSGLHSYGFGHGGELFYYLYLAAEILFLSVIFLKKLIYKNSQD